MKIPDYKIQINKTEQILDFPKYQSSNGKYLKLTTTGPEAVNLINDLYINLKTILVNTSTINFTENDSDLTIQADVNDSSIVESKLADSAVSTNKIQDLCVTTIKIQDNAISNAKISANAVTRDKIIDNAINNAKVSVNSLNIDRILGLQTALNSKQSASAYLDAINQVLSTSSTPTFTGLNSNGDISVSAYNIITDTTVGTKFATATSQKISFHNATPTVQRSGAAQAAVVTTEATNISPYGFTTAAQANAIITLLNEIRSTLVEKGIMKGSA